MKFKLNFKAHDEQLTVEDLTSDLLLKLATQVWNKHYRKKFDKQASFLETECEFDSKNDGSWSYEFWIGDLFFTDDDYENGVDEIFGKYYEELAMYLRSKGLNVRITNDGVYPDDAGYHGRGFIRVLIESTKTGYEEFVERIFDFYAAHATVLDHGLEDQRTRYFIQYKTIDSEVFRVEVVLWLKAIAKLEDRSVRTTYVPFSSNELEFFDKLGCQLLAAFERETGQDISDWWE